MRFSLKTMNSEVEERERERESKTNSKHNPIIDNYQTCIVMVIYRSPLIGKQFSVFFSSTHVNSMNCNFLLFFYFPLFHWSVNYDEMRNVEIKFENWKNRMHNWWKLYPPSPQLESNKKKKDKRVHSMNIDGITDIKKKARSWCTRFHCVHYCLYCNKNWGSFFFFSPWKWKWNNG